MTLETVRADLSSKCQGHKERKCENRFGAYLRGKWVDLRQTKTKVILVPAEMRHFVLFVCLSVCLSHILISFTQCWNVVESLYFGGSYPVR